MSSLLNIHTISCVMLSEWVTIKLNPTESPSTDYPQPNDPTAAVTKVLSLLYATGQTFATFAQVIATSHYSHHFWRLALNATTITLASVMPAQPKQIFGSLPDFYYLSTFSKLARNLSYPIDHTQKKTVLLRTHRPINWWIAWLYLAGWYAVFTGICSLSVRVSTSNWCL